MTGSNQIQNCNRQQYGRTREHIHIIGV